LLEKIFKLSVLTPIRCEFVEHSSAILENQEQSLLLKLKKKPI